MEGVVWTSRDGEIILFVLGKVKGRARNKIKFNQGKIETAMPRESNLKHKYSVGERTGKANTLQATKESESIKN